MAGDTPETVFTISDPAVLKVVAQPLRLRILEHLRANAGAALSVKELAAALGSSQTGLYYHVNLLAEHGLIRVAETRLVSGIVERRYRVNAYRLSFDRTLLAGPEADDGLEVWLSVVLDEVRSEIRKAVLAGLIDLDRSADGGFGPRRLVLGRIWLSLTPAELAEFERRFDELTEAFGSADPNRQAADTRLDATLYELVLGFYPTVPPGRRTDTDSPPNP